MSKPENTTRTDTHVDKSDQKKNENLDRVTRFQQILEEQVREKDKSPISTNSLADWLRDAKSALAQGKTEISADLVEGLLAIRPQDPAAHYLRGQIHTRLGNTLEALADFHRTTTHSADKKLQGKARMAAAQLLLDLGQYARALEMLDGLGGKKVQQLKTRIQHESRGNPAVLVQPSTDIVMYDTLQRVPVESTYYGYCALTIDAVGQPVKSNQDAWLQRILRDCYEFVEISSGLRHTAGDPIFSLRFINRIDQEKSTNKLTIALIIRVTGIDPDATVDLALDVFRTVHAILPDAGHTYYYAPVMEQTKIQELLTPFEVEHVSEIVRRESVSDNSDSPYAVYPFTSGHLNLHKMLTAVLRQTTSAIVSIHLLPTTLMEWEKGSLDAHMVKLDSPARSADSMVDLQEDPVTSWWRSTPRFNRAQVNRHLLDHLDTTAYLLSINVACAQGSNSLFANQVASVLVGAPQSIDGAIVGGYEVVHTQTDHEDEVARRNIERLDIEKWVFTAAPAGCERLRHLVTQKEAAMCFRLPVPGSNGLPGLKTIETKMIKPPDTLPHTGIILGESVSLNEGMPITIRQGMEDRRRHTYIVGKTGTGKSTLIQNLALQDIEAGHGICVIDPHGDLISEILPRIPKRRGHDVILFDPADDSRPIGLNLLEARNETEKHIIINEFIALLHLMYDPGNTGGIVGPRFQHNVRNAMLTAMSVKGNTLIEVVRVLTDSLYVRALLPSIEDPFVRNYWEKQIANTSDFHKSEVLDYLVSKFSRFVSDTRIRNIIGQPSTALNFRQIMDDRQILLVNLSKGEMGPESAQFLGLLLMQRLLLAALSRADAPKNERPDFMLYVDEFQNFATPMFSTVLSEGRKYGIAATVANQYLTQLSSATREAIFGNVGTIVSFQLGVQDALILAPETYPAFGSEDLISLPKFTACVKLLTAGNNGRPFTMRTLPDLRMSDPMLARAITQLSREYYGQDAGSVTTEILTRFGIIN